MMHGKTFLKDFFFSHTNGHLISVDSYQEDTVTGNINTFGLADLDDMMGTAISS